MSTKTNPVRLFVTVVSCALAAGDAPAAEYTWNSTGGPFDDASRWSPAGGPPGAGDSAVFDSPTPGGYIVSLPAGVRPIDSLRVLGEIAYLAGNTGVLQVNSAADDAVLVRSNGSSRSVLGLGGIPGGQGSYGNLSVPNGGITLSGTTGVPSSQNELTGGSITADRLFVLGGAVSAGQMNIARDIQLGNAGTARGGAPVAFFTGGRFDVPVSVVGGAIRIHPDGSLVGAVNAAGGVQNAGRIEEATRITGDLVNSGDFYARGESGPAGLSIVDGDFVQTPDGVLHLPSSRFQSNKPLTLSNGTIDLGGTIVVTPGSFTQLNDRLPLIGAAAPINYSATLTSAVEGYRFDPQLVPGDGLYALVTAVPEPTAAALAALLALPALRRHRRRR